MGIKIVNPHDGTFIIRPVEFEDSIKRSCRLEHSGIRARVYVTKNSTRLRVTTLV